ncbi:hypothetical protein RHSP_08534 [Rhizobium freirei PRF 81]|uniref:Uncharacterized protein n=1 Tax=Rhizobium freirei PRF 81 TaxID=363754 RepID=N6USS4_9HYPH|nr:hypothetical protein RHSP_08534 [Rhizobium freirei PRF 81]
MLQLFREIALRLVGIGMRRRYGARPARARLLPGIGLHHVEIIGLARRHDDLVALARQLDADLRLFPGHQQGAFRIDAAAMGDFVPAGQLAAALVEHRLDPLEEIGLQGEGARYAFLLHEPARQRRSEPGAVGNLIPADMEILRGEELDHFVEDLGEEFVGRLDGRVQGIVRIALDGMIALRRFLTVRQIRQGDEGRGAVAGDIDLRHDLDAECGGMSDDLAHVILRVEAADRFGAIAELRQQRLVRPAQNAGGRQLRIGADLQSPCLIVRQVPMEDVELQPGENVEQAQDICLGSKLP